MMGLFFGALLMTSGNPTVITPGERVDIIAKERAWQPKPLSKRPYLGVSHKPVNDDFSDEVFINIGDTTLLLALSILAEYKDLAVDVETGVDVEKRLSDVNFNGVGWSMAISMLAEMSNVEIYPSESGEVLRVRARNLSHD